MQSDPALASQQQKLVFASKMNHTFCHAVHSSVQAQQVNNHKAAIQSTTKLKRVIVQPSIKSNCVDSQLRIIKQLLAARTTLQLKFERWTQLLSSSNF